MTMAKLQREYATLEGLPQVYHQLYERRADGVFELVGLEGAVSAAEVDAGMEELRAEREAHKRTKATLRALEAAEADPALAERERAILAETEELKRQCAERDARISELRADRDRWRIAEAVRGIARDAGLRADALEDAIVRAERELEVHGDGAVTARDGQSVLAWLASKRETRPIWFQEPRRTVPSLFD
jgi:hypothetical protein